jgi:hypothetical protein
VLAGYVAFGSYPAGDVVDVSVTADVSVVAVASEVVASVVVAVCVASVLVGFEKLGPTATTRRAATAEATAAIKSCFHRPLPLTVVLLLSRSAAPSGRSVPELRAF